MDGIKCAVGPLQTAADGNMTLTVTIDPSSRRSVADEWRELRGKTLSLALKQWRKKRSLDANAYFWVLCHKLAAKLRQPVNDVYRQYMRNIGGNAEILPVRNDAVETWVKNWESRGLGWICEVIGDSKIRKYTTVMCYYGSSCFDTATMCVLIDMVVGDCKEHGIETEPPERLASMMAEFERRERRKEAKQC